MILTEFRETTLGMLIQETIDNSLEALVDVIRSASSRSSDNISACKYYLEYLQDLVAENNRLVSLRYQQDGRKRPSTLGMPKDMRILLQPITLLCRRDFGYDYKPHKLRAGSIHFTEEEHLLIQESLKIELPKAITAIEEIIVKAEKKPPRRHTLKISPIKPAADVAGRSASAPPTVRPQDRPRVVTVSMLRSMCPS